MTAERIKNEINDTKKAMQKTALEIQIASQKIKGSPRDSIHISRISTLSLELSNLRSVLEALLFVQ